MALKEIATVPIGVTAGHGKYAFASTLMLMWLKGLALDPCNMKSSPHDRLRNQVLKIRKILSTSHVEVFERKRKFKQYISDGAFGLSRGEKYDNQNAKKQRRGQLSSLSCSPNCKEKCCCSLQGKQGTAFLALNDTENCSISRQDFSHLSDSDEYIKGTKPMLKGNLKGHYKGLTKSKTHKNEEKETARLPLRKKDGYTHATQTSIKEKPDVEFSKVLKSLVSEDFDYSSESSHSSTIDKDDMELSLFNNGNDDDLPRPVIPIGPRFQVEVPKWEDPSPTNKIHHNGDDDLRLVGIQIWPMPDAKETNTKAIGKGRVESCSCDFPGSINCVKQHISEARSLLQYDIGTTFSSWKFDEMGDVSKSWTLKEKKEFESLVRFNPLSNERKFWKLAMEQFPSKSMKTMVNYYYNIYIPRRMSIETRSFGEIDSDDDYHNEDDSSTTEDDCSTIAVRRVPICKILKSRISSYLTIAKCKRACNLTDIRLDHY